MFETLRQIISAQWERRSQILNLAKFELRKKFRGTALGPVWLFAGKLVYIAVFWFALEIGLRGSRDVGGDAPYILWLTAGLVPWFYMSDMINGGINVFRKFKYLVSKIKFPLPAIPTIYSSASMFIHLCFVGGLLVLYFASGQPLSVYLLQLPFAIVLMSVFFYMYSLTMSCLSTISRDFHNFMSTLSTPMFWVSGIIFNVFGLGISWLETLLMFNPITFVVTFYRAIFFDQIWIWEKPMALVGFGVVFLVMALLMIVVYRRTHEEVHDVI
ncbi:MAG: ABC transporter permease [Adlercreutzia sp.]|nr:ABC transporter permease [Adlercreutzia sp.]